MRPLYSTCHYVLESTLALSVSLVCILTVHKNVPPLDPLLWTKTLYLKINWRALFPNFYYTNALWMELLPQFFSHSLSSSFGLSRQGLLLGLLSFLVAYSFCSGERRKRAGKDPRRVGADFHINLATQQQPDSDDWWETDKRACYRL